MKALRKASWGGSSMFLGCKALLLVCLQPSTGGCLSIRSTCIGSSLRITQTCQNGRPQEWIAAGSSAVLLSHGSGMVFRPGTCKRLLLCDFVESLCSVVPRELGGVPKNEPSASNSWPRSWVQRCSVVGSRHGQCGWPMAGKVSETSNCRCNVAVPERALRIPCPRMLTTCVTTCWAYALRTRSRRKQTSAAAQGVITCRYQGGDRSGMARDR